MAAAEYYNTGPPRPSAPYLAPPGQQQHSPGFVYPQAHSAPNASPHQGPRYYPTPPPYQEPLGPSARPPNSQPNVHFTPPPQRASFSHPQRPPPQSWSGSYQNPPKHQQQQMPYARQPVQHAPHMRPYLNNNHSDYSLSSGGYSSEPEARHSRHHRKRKDSRPTRERGSSDTSRSTNTDGFIGAAGGGLIGDLIFPGLGTLGGALAGWVGGKDYGKHRKHKEERREREQREWERKHSLDKHYDNRRRSGSHDSRNRSRSRSRSRSQSHNR